MPRCDVFTKNQIDRFMSVEKFQNKYRIPSARATWHDYSGGVYFVTICTAEHNHFFGEITNGKMQLTKIGEYTDGCVREIGEHFPDAQIPLYVIMPNHLHLIVFIDSRDGACSVSKTGDSAIQNETRSASERDGACTVSTGMAMKSMPKNEKMRLISHAKGRLSTVIGSIKSAVTRYANKNQIPFGWQTRFHDRIVRNQNELNRIAEYIENNPLNWTADRYYS